MHIYICTYIYIIHLFTYIVYLFINLKYLSGNYAIVDSSCQCDLDYLAVVDKSNVFFCGLCVEMSWGKGTVCQTVKGHHFGTCGAPFKKRTVVATFGCS